jgi:hypothetical protein
LRGDGHGGDFGDGDVQQFEYRGDDYGAERRFDDGDVHSWRDDLFRLGHYLRTGTDRHGDADGDGEFAADQREFYSQYDRVPGRVGAGGAVADFLPGNHGDADGIPAGWIWIWWRDRDALGRVDDGRGGVCVSPVASICFDVCVVGDRGVGCGVVRKFAEESDGAGYASGNVFNFVDGDIEWTVDYAAEFLDAGGEVVSFAAVLFLSGAGNLFLALFFA